MLTFGSFCSGIGAPEVAWGRLGWRSAFAAEVAAFPSAVLAARHPGTVNLGDMERIDGQAVAARFGPVDVLVAGTPCQSFSVAGLRRGLDDPRGNLALVFLRLVDAIRPRWLVWENVDGVRSGGRGRDFGAFLGALGQLGYGWAYRVLDAQYGGVPQRRRRVFVVGHLGDWRRAAAVLLERQSLCGHPPPSREAGARTASSLKAGSGGGCGPDDNDATGGRLIAGTLSCQYAKQSHNGMVEMENGLVSHTLRADGFDASEDGTGRGVPLVTSTLSANGDSHSEFRNDGGLIPIDMRQASRGGRMTNNRPTGSSGGPPGTGVGTAGDPSPSLSLSHAPAVFSIRTNQTGANGANVSAGRCPTPGADSAPAVAAAGTAVRRLMPVECERLMGFEDGYTAVEYRGKPAADGPRYRALGNSMVVNEMEWIGRRIALVNAIPAEQGAA